MGTKKMKVSTSWAFVIWAFLLTAGFAYTGLKPGAQFLTYAMFLTLGLGGYTGKRLIQKRPNFNGKKTRKSTVLDKSKVNLNGTPIEFL